MTMKVCIINLARSPKRLKFMQQQLVNIGLDFERIEAVDGSQLDKTTLTKYQQQSKQSYLHYNQLNAGEIGCAMSWHKVWALIANGQQKSVIAIEDDVALGGNFLKTTEALLDKMDENIIIDLSGKKGFLIKETKIINGIKLIRYQTPPLKTQGQIYGKKACQTLLNKIQNFKAPVDTLQQMLWLHGIQIWSLEAGCVSHQNFSVGGSTITTTKKPLLIKLKKELSRPFWRGFIIIKNFL